MLKFKQIAAVEKMPLKDADRMTNSADPDYKFLSKV